MAENNEKQTEREAFETWVTGGKPSSATERKANYEGLCGWDEYRSTHTAAMWQTWQARAAIHAEAMKRIAGAPVAQCEHDLRAEYEGQNGTRAAICAKCGERVQTSASPAALTVPAAITDWHAAWQAHVDAVATYNARVAFARANEGKNIGTISVQAEYNLMHDAKNKVFTLLPALFEGIGSLLAASPADQVEDARDAARYRWLRENGMEDAVLGYDDSNWGFSWLLQREQLDSGIDAAMSATPPAAE